eukprot:CAMPEP_0119305720 /NCGR_PEP_ID=MMETSP1333-20130426/6649_1 /TAXON_ID=418940 /ORGANISM="Scyphosphaera apsteinii, Strain RCC1455" /LENGTH=650 /DNA_ID=CAMNT_0007308881 /DNA_START=25 /DNA_END=1977 /DNA_ORIENTATION=+
MTEIWVHTINCLAIWTAVSALSPIELNFPELELHSSHLHDITLAALASSEVGQTSSSSGTIRLDDSAMNTGYPTLYVQPNRRPSSQQKSTVSQVRVGAIRWDAWSGRASGHSARQQADCSSPLKWRSRLPSCGIVEETDRVDLACSSEQQIRNEVQLAASSGINYWAFVLYHASADLSTGLQVYLQTSQKQGVGFSVIVQLGYIPTSLSNSLWDGFMARMDGMFAMDEYETVDGAPLVFVFTHDFHHVFSRFAQKSVSACLTKCNDTEANCSTETCKVGKFEMEAMALYFELLQSWSNLAIRRLHFCFLGLSERAPYYKLLRSTGLVHSLSAYATAAEGYGGPFSELDDLASRSMRSWLANGDVMVSFATTGWDPRMYNTGCAGWRKSTNHSWAQLPSTFEVVRSVVSAVEAACAAQASQQSTGHALVYAWNEFGEGGWLAPTLGDGTSRLDALRVALKSYGGAEGESWPCPAPPSRPPSAPDPPSPFPPFLPPLLPPPLPPLPPQPPFHPPLPPLPPQPPFNPPLPPRLPPSEPPMLPFEPSAPPSTPPSTPPSNPRAAPPAAPPYYPASAPAAPPYYPASAPLDPPSAPPCSPPSAPPTCPPFSPSVYPAFYPPPQASPAALPFVPPFTPPFVPPFTPPLAPAKVPLV